MKYRTSKWLLQNPFLRKVGILTGGTVFAQAIAIIAMPLLARLYTPEDFSLLAVYASLLSIVTVVACLRYNIAISLPASDEEAFELLVVSCGLAAIVSVFVALPIAMDQEAVASLIGRPDMASFLWMLPIGIFLAAAYDAMLHWALRMQRYWSLTFTRISRASGSLSVQVGIGLAMPSPFGLVFGHMLFGGLGLLGLGLDLLRKDRSILCQYSYKRSLERAIEYYRFPVFSVPEALMNTMSAELPIILIAAMTAGPEAGFVMLAMRVIGLPMALIGNSVAQAYLAEARHKLLDGTLVSFTRSTMRTLLKTGAIPILAAGFVSPFIFPVAFGEQWARSGYLVAWMVPWFFLQFIASPVSMVLHVLRKQIWAAYLQGAGLIIRISAVLTAGMHFPDRIGEAFAVSGALFYSVYIWVILTLMRRNP